MRLRLVCTLLALGVMLLASGCHRHRCWCRRHHLFRFRNCCCAPCCPPCGTTCCYPAADLHAPPPLAPVPPLAPGPSLHAPLPAGAP